MVDHVNGMLGIAERLSPSTIDDDPRRGAAGDRALWDPEGFRAGLRDLAGATLTPQGIAAFLQSDRLQVLPEELPIIYLELGGRGAFPGPS